MGTRADFYIGKGKESKWVGSCALDGYPSGVSNVLSAVTEKQFCEKVSKLKTYIPTSNGWPWAWNGSGGTDYSYYYTENGILVFHWGVLDIDYFLKHILLILEDENLSDIDRCRIIGRLK